MNYDCEYSDLQVFTKTRHTIKRPGVAKIMNFNLGMLSLKWLGDIQVNVL